MKVVIIGGSAGGASVAARLRRIDEKAEIIVLEKSASISYAICGIPYYLGNVVKDSRRLQILDSNDFTEILNVTVHTKSEVLAINRRARSVTVKNLESGELFDLKYDYLVLSTGSIPVAAGLPGSDAPHVFSLRNEYDINAVKRYISVNVCKNALIVGAGLIGLEAAENLCNIGVNVSIVDRNKVVLNPWDFEMANMLQSHLRDKGVRLYLQTTVKNIGTHSVQLEDGTQINADIIILALGAKPNTALAQEAGIKIGQRGGVLVNPGMLSSDNRIFALGDVVEVKHKIILDQTVIPLAGQAHKQARVVADNICHRFSVYKPTVGTAIVKVFDMCAALAGATEWQLAENGINYEKSYTEIADRAGFYPDAHNMTIKLLYAARTGTLLGAQIVGTSGVDKRIDVIATAISFEKNVVDLIDLDLAYAPPYSSAKDPVNVAGMVAQNQINGEIQSVHWDELEMFDPRNSVFLDIRTSDEFEISTLKNAINIPLTQLRQRSHEIPTRKRIVIICNYGKLGYFACKILQHKGFNDVYNLNGGLNIYKLAHQTSYESLLQVNNTVAVSDTADLRLFPGSDLSMDYTGILPKPENRKNNIIEVDVCGLSCPGPMLKLKRTMNSASVGDVIRILSTDSAFTRDLRMWCQTKGHKILDLDNSKSTISAVLQKC